MTQSYTVFWTWLRRISINLYFTSQERGLYNFTRHKFSTRSVICYLSAIYESSTYTSSPYIKTLYTEALPHIGQLFLTINCTSSARSTDTNLACWHTAIRYLFFAEKGIITCMFFDCGFQSNGPWANGLWQLPGIQVTNRIYFGEHLSTAGLSLSISQTCSGGRWCKVAKGNIAKYTRLPHWKIKINQLGEAQSVRVQWTSQDTRPRFVKVFVIGYLLCLYVIIWE